MINAINDEKMAPIIPDKVIRDFIEYITARDDWMASNENHGDEEWGHVIYAAPMFGTFIALVQYDDDRTTDRQFYIWEPLQISPANDEEDEMLRAYDNECSILDREAWWTRIYEAGK